MTSIAITAVAAIIVAVIAAVTARSRQIAQLSAERGRLDLTLEAEHQRQHRGLEHERALHDLAGLRAILDDAAGIDALQLVVSTASMTVAAATFHAGSREAPPHPDYDDGRPPPWDDVHDSLHAIYAATEALTQLGPRLRIRFAYGEPVVSIV